MVSADEVPFCFAGFDALDIRRVVLVPGLTGSPSRHMVLATSFARPRLILTSSGRRRAGCRRPIDFASDHDGPDCPGRSVRHGDGRESERLAGEQRVDPRIGRARMGPGSAEERPHARYPKTPYTH